MSHSTYYQHTPGWGTNKFHFLPPPAPSFQPQASWGGYDYYLAHAANPDPQLFDHAWRYVRDHQGRGRGNLAVGTYDARHYHRRAYGSMGLNSMPPAEIGHAAAYEAYRTWIYNSSIYEPISGDIERQRDGLIGLAVAEATRLMQGLGRSLDSYGRMTAVDAAASTAAKMFDESDEEDDHFRRSSRSEYDNPYANDEPLMIHRSSHRSHGHDLHRSQSMLIPHPGQYSGASSSARHMPSANAMVPYGTTGAGYAGYMPQSYPGQGLQVPGYGHGHGHYGGHQPQPPLPPPQPHFPVVVPQPFERQRRSSMSVPMTYSTSASGAGAGVPLVLSTSSSRKKHRHSHSSSKRSRSQDPTLQIEYPGYARSSGY